MNNLIQNALCEEIAPYRRGQIKGFCLKDFEDIDIHTLPFDIHPENFAESFRLIKKTRSRCIISFEYAKGDVTRRVYVKRYKVWRISRKLSYLFIPSKCIREWRLGYALLKKGIMTPLPLIAAVYRKGLFIKENYLVTLGIEPMEPLIHILKNAPDDQTKKDILKDWALFLRKTHQQGFYHDDLSLHHVFSDQPSGEKRRFALIDLDNGVLLGKLPQRLIIRNLFQMLRSANMTIIPREERMNFLESYLGSAPSGNLINDINALARRNTGQAIISN